MKTRETQSRRSLQRLVRMQTLFCAKCGQPYKTDKPYLTIGGKPMGLRRLCYDCELAALAGMLADETAS